MLEIILMIGLTAAFVMLLLGKWNYFEKFRVITKREPCYFCHCFWICFLLSIVLVLGLDLQYWRVVMAFAATPITWYISVR